MCALVVRFAGDFPEHGCDPCATSQLQRSSLSVVRSAFPRSRVLLCIDTMAGGVPCLPQILLTSLPLLSLGDVCGHACGPRRPDTERCFRISLVDVDCPRSFALPQPCLTCPGRTAVWLTHEVEPARARSVKASSGNLG